MAGHTLGGRAQTYLKEVKPVSLGVIKPSIVIVSCKWMRQRKKYPNASKKLNSLECFVTLKKIVFKVFVCNQEGLKIK